MAFVLYVSATFKENRIINTQHLIFTLFVCLLFNTVILQANDAVLNFERAPLDIHLPQSSVYSIIQDQQGFLWFATREGVARWDGYKMLVLRNKPFDEKSLPGNVVHNLIEDCHGNIWAWTQGDPYNRISVARITASKNIVVKRYAYNDAMLFKGKDCALWLVDNNGFYRYDYNNDRFNQIIKINTKTRITTGIQSDENTLWLGDDKGNIFNCSITLGQCHIINTQPAWPYGHGIITLYENSNKQILVTAWQQGMVAVNTVNEKLEKLASLPIYFDKLIIRKIVKSINQSLLMITSVGVIRSNLALSNFIQTPILHDNGTNNPDGNTIFQDNTGAIWVGSMWGVYVADLYRKKFNHMGHNPIDNNSLSAGLVMSIHAENDNLWVGSFGGGLNRIDLKSGDVKRFPTAKQVPGYGTFSNIVWSIDHDSKGNIWIASESLNRLDTHTDKIKIFKADPENFINKTHIEHKAFTDTINDIYVDNNDVIWLATATGLFSFDNQSETFSDNYLAEIGYIYNVTDAGNGNLWIGSSHAGLIKFNPQRGIIKHYQYQADKPGTISNNTILFVYKDSLSNLWVGTYSGLNRLDESLDTFQLYSVDDGLPGDAIIYMLEVNNIKTSKSDSAELWISTNRGLAKLKVNETEVLDIRIFDTSYGINNTEFNRNAATEVNGDFYFGGDRGITHFLAKNIIDNPYEPSIAFTGAYQINESNKKRSEIDHHQQLFISAETSVFGFEFASLSFSYPNHNQYQYLLQGFETNWSQPNHQRQANYPNVPPGQYIFRVRASNADGIWNKQGISIKVTVMPWFWETLWFQLVMICLLLMTIVLAVVYVMRNRYNKHVQKIKYHQALLDERNRISQDMHDEIGASLSEIVIFSQQHAISNASQPFDKIAQRAREVLESIGEIIWATNPRNDKLATLLAYMREQAYTILDNVNIDVNLDFPRHIDDVQISAEVRRNLYLIMKEAIINVLKHAQANTISICVTIQNCTLLLLIEDDGNGRLKHRKNGMGLKNMQKRADVLQASLSIQSIHSIGTEIKLSLLISPP